MTDTREDGFVQQTAIKKNASTKDLRGAATAETVELWKEGAEEVNETGLRGAPGPCGKCAGDRRLGHGMLTCRVQETR